MRCAMTARGAMRGLAALGAVALLCGPGPARSATCRPKAVTASTFNTGLQSWTSNTPTQIAWQATGGNPGGFVQFTDMSSATTYIDAPAAYHGSWSALDGAGYLTYQHDIISETGVTGYSPYQVNLSGPGGAATFYGATPSAASTGWQTIVAPLVSADWTVTSGTWSALLANVTDLQIVIDLVSNATIPGDTDIEGIDNVALVALPCGFYTPPK